MRNFKFFISLFIFNLLPSYAFSADDFTPVSREILEEALSFVDTLEGCSRDYSWSAYFENTSDDRGYYTWVSDLNDGRSGRYEDPVIKAMAPFMIAMVQYIYNTNNRRVSHIAIRIDPDTRNMVSAQKGRPNNRKASLVWHTHNPTSNYIYTLSRQEETTTQIREEGIISHVPLQSLFLLLGNMEHRTPPQTQEHFRRIQFTFGLAQAPDRPLDSFFSTMIEDNLNITEDGLKKRKRNELLDNSSCKKTHFTNSASM